MTRLRFNWAEAKRHLRSSCDPMRGFIDFFGAERYSVRDGGDLFQALARSIAYQQLSGKAAGTIHGRFEDLFEDRPNAPDTLVLGYEPLRGAGLSNAKTLAILDLAERQASGQLPSARKLGGMADEDIIDRLSQVRGIGPWTVQMHLIFYLGRPDVMPTTDLGVQKGVRNIYGLDNLPDPKETLERTAHLAPFRSAAAWYCWRAADIETP